MQLLLLITSANIHSEELPVAQKAFSIKLRKVEASREEHASGTQLVTVGTQPGK